MPRRATSRKATKTISNLPNKLSDTLQAGPSTRPSPKARRRAVSPEKTVRFGRGASIIQGPSGKDYDKRRSLPHTARGDRHLRQTGSIKKKPSSGPAQQSPRKSKAGASAKKFDTELQAQFDRDVRQADRIESLKAPKSKKAVEKERSSVKKMDEDDRKDFVVCKRMAELTESVYLLSQQSHSSPGTTSKAKRAAYLDRILRSPGNAQLVRYIGFLAIAGPKGEESWAELLSNDGCRRALIMAVVFHALKTAVFEAQYFGASEAQEKKLQDLELDGIDQDGFYRTQERAAMIASFPYDPSDADLLWAESKLVLQLERLITPLWKVTGPPDAQTGLQMRRDLGNIVDQAARLSRIMRLSGNVIYHFGTTCKDELFDPRRMDCINLLEMLRDSPYDRKQYGRLQRSVLREGQEARSNLVVRIVCCPGIEAYRQGGGRLAKSELAQERRNQQAAPPDVRQLWRHNREDAESLTGMEGFRSKIICASVVMLQWGRQRLLTREAGTSAHLKAKREGRTDKYEKDAEGFVELYDLGLAMWRSEEEANGGK